MGSKTTKGAVVGGLVGAGAGALAGSQTGHTGTGAAIGAGLGALAGGFIGHALEKQERELKRIEAESYRRDQEVQDMAVRRNAETQALVVTLAGDFLFDTDSAAIKPGAQDKLSRIAGVLASDASTTILVKGHADSRGSEAYNLALSERRAAAVKDALVQAGVGATRITTVGYGETRPILSENTPAAWQRNRRVELDVRAGGGGAAQ
jgi:outer membrane protein OmpA-like peptidoglycan-associated protein